MVALLVIEKTQHGNMFILPIQIAQMIKYVIFLGKKLQTEEFIELSNILLEDFRNTKPCAKCQPHIKEEIKELWRKKLQ